MKDPILTNVILSSKAEQVEKYVKNYLPNNPQTLQRIYHDLATFNSTINDMIQGKIQIPENSSQSNTNKVTNIKDKTLLRSKSLNLKRHSSQNQLSSRKGNQYFERNKQQNITKRQQALIRSLKQKGLRGNTEQIPFGIQIIQREEKKISKPLQVNKMTEINDKNSLSIRKCINRFNINKDFYTNTIKDGQIDAEKYYDREMKMFLDSRTVSLKKINAKEEFQNQTKKINARRYSHVDSVLFNKIKGISEPQTFKTQSNLGMDTWLPQPKQKNRKLDQFSNKKSTQAQNLIKTCRDELKDETSDYRPKSLLSENKNYETLRIKSQSLSKQMDQMKERLQFDGMELENNSLQIDQMARQYTNKKLIDKYTLNYLKVIMGKHSIQTILANRKDLLRNQLKFRKILIDK